MWPISIIEICIYDLPQTLEYNIFEAFHLAPCSAYHLIFLNQHISLWDRCLKFLIFQFDGQVFGFLGIIHFIFWSLFIFPSQILVCATGFCSSISLFIWRFTFGELFKQKKEESGKIYRHKSQDQQNHSLVIHDKVEDLFTTVTLISKFLSQWYECIGNKLCS